MAGDAERVRKSRLSGSTLYVDDVLRARAGDDVSLLKPGILCDRFGVRDLTRPEQAKD